MLYCRRYRLWLGLRVCFLRVPRQATDVMHGFGMGRKRVSLQSVPLLHHLIPGLRRPMPGKKRRRGSIGMAC